MRKIGHKADVQRLRESFDYYRKEIKLKPDERKAAKRSRDADYFEQFVKNSIIVARSGYLFDMPLAEIHFVLRTALPDLQSLLDAGGYIDKGEMRDYLGAALLTGDPAIVKWMAHLPREAYDDPDVEASEALFALTEAIQAGAQGNQKKMKTSVEKLPDLLSLRKLIVEAKSEKAMYDPLHSLLQAIVNKDQKAFEKAWQAEEVAWKKRYGRPSEAANMDGILDLTALGIARIAQKFGLSVPAGNAYAPLELLDPGKPL
jgi:hypothetical protein